MPVSYTHLFGGFQKERGNLFVALVLGDRRKIGVFVARLRLACKGCFQILFGLGAGVFVQPLGGRFFQFFKGGSRLPADRAGEVLGQAFSLVDITAVSYTHLDVYKRQL